MARVLLVDDDPASRLALQTVLRAGGYDVDAAASAAEAIAKLDEDHYELVLTDLRMESPEAGYRVLAHARIVDYRPAAAVITTYRDESVAGEPDDPDRPLFIAPEDVPELLATVADLIATRATRQVNRALRQAS
jgi:two-component system response regulator PilR (NtrC family)